VPVPGLGGCGKVIGTEKDYLEFRAEAFNTFNHTNPSNPNTTLGNSNYNKVTVALDPRILEFALRLKF
jgi:hypothetical protein